MVMAVFVLLIVLAVIAPVAPVKLPVPLPGMSGVSSLLLSAGHACLVVFRQLGC
jgi:hypothetical protein